MKKFLVALASLVLTLGLASCSGTASESVDPGYPTSTGAPEKPNTDGGGVAPTEGAGGVDRQVIETAFVSLEIVEMSEAISAVKSMVASQVGFIDSWQQQTNDAGELWQVYATLRLPAATLDESLDLLSAIGTLKSLERSATDVTTQVIDLDARIASLEASVERLLALIDAATNTSDLLEAESYLSQRQGELESLKSQRDYLTSAVEYSTVSLSMYQKGTAAQDEPANFWEGLIAGWNGLGVFLGGALVVFGLVTPWLLAVVPIGAVVWWLVRRSKSGHRPAA